MEKRLEYLGYTARLEYSAEDYIEYLLASM